MEYALTDLGRSLIGPVRGLVVWLEERQDEIEGHRERYDRPVETGRRPGIAIT